MEFLVRIYIDLPADMPAERERELRDAEGKRARALRDQGTIVRIWRLPGQPANVGIWAAPDATALHDALTSMPLFPWFRVEVEALATHYIETT